MKRSHLIYSLFFCLALASGHKKVQAEDQQNAATAAKAIRTWQFEKARKIIGALQHSNPGSALSRYLQAELDFYDGAYDKVLVGLEGLDDDDIDGNVGPLRSLAASSYQVTKNFKLYTSAGGHFKIYYAPGKDQAIVKLSAEVLESAYEALGEDLGHRPSEPIRIELLSKPSLLAQVSTLTASEIETTGTIALCKYGKLMVVSPRATLFGYPWMDTLTHEYVHYVVTQMSQDKVPVWMHEGLARYLQVRWRGKADGKLGPMDQHLLSSALKKKKLVSFDDMHPSMAKLPSQEAAALAFAEVSTMIAFVHQQVGNQGLQAAIKSVRSGRSARKAVAHQMDKSWKDVEKDWKRYLKSSHLQSTPFAARGKKIRFRKGTSEDNNVGVEAIANKKAQRFTRLAGILRSKGKVEAAALEYEKAMSLAGGQDPLIGAKLSSVYLQLGRLQEAVKIAEPLLDIDEMDPLPPTTLGAAYFALGDYLKASQAFARALRISPFDSRVRCGLAQSYKELKDKRAEDEQEACQLLQQVR